MHPNEALIETGSMFVSIKMRVQRGYRFPWPACGGAVIQDLTRLLYKTASRQSEPNPDPRNKRLPLGACSVDCFVVSPLDRSLDR